VHISPTERTADVFVHPDMVSLAIGREGQNSRLAARLTGFRINIRDASAPAETRGVAAPDEELVSADAAESNGSGDAADGDAEIDADVAGATAERPAAESAET